MVPSQASLSALLAFTRTAKLELAIVSTMIPPLYSWTAIVMVVLPTCQSPGLNSTERSSPLPLNLILSSRTSRAFDEVAPRQNVLPEAHEFAMSSVDALAVQSGMAQHGKRSRA